MTSQSPLIQRLKTHQVNTRRMLAPGLKDLARQQRSISPVLDGWGSQKYAAFARNMRFLSEERLGHLTPEKINLIGRDLPARFSDPAKLLHIHPPTARENSIWSDVEKTLPSSAGQVGADVQAPPDPGTLRQGSIIQRFRTVPKPGQSFESFKEQIQSRAALPKPAAAPPPRPRPKPGEPVRRYSRIEEITGKEPPAPTEPSAQPPDTVQRQMEPAPGLKPGADEPLLRTSEPAPELPRQAADVPSVEPLRADSLDNQQPDQAVAQTAKLAALPSVEQPKADISDRPDSHPVLAMPVKAAHLPKQPQERALPKSEAPSTVVKLAQPVARNQTRISRQPEAQMPRAMPAPKESAPTPKSSSLSRATSRPEQAAPRFAQPAPGPSAPLATATVQRQEEPDAIPQAQPPSEAASPAGQVEAPAKTISPEVGATPQSTETLPDSPRQPESLPLLRLAQRKAAPEQIRFVTPKVAKPDVQRPTLIQRNLPRIGRGQPIRAASPAPVPDRVQSLPPQPLVRSAADGGSPAPRVGGDTTSSVQKMEMPVARTVEKPAPLARVVPPASLPPAAPLPPAQNNQPQSSAAPPAPAIASAASNVVQRLWEGHSPPASQSGGSTGSASESGAESGAGLDLDKLAEQVFPIVKRLIEIESERSSGYLR